MELPIEYRWLTAHGFKGFIPWHLLEELGAEGLRREYQQETGDDFYPFAHRQDNDDTAGFKVEHGHILSEVVTVHLTWSGRNEQNEFPTRVTSKDMFEWLQDIVIPDTSEWMSEPDLDDLLKEQQ